MEEKKKVILIKGDNSKWYEEAIFIMRTDIPSKSIPIDFVLEAEKIINNYMQKCLSSQNKTLSLIKPQNKMISKEHTTVKREDKKLNNILNICIVLCCILLSVILYSFTK